MKGTGASSPPGGPGPGSAQAAPPSAADLLVNTNDEPWRAKSLPGLHEKMLWRDEQTGASIALVRFEKGAGIPKAHKHPSNQFMFTLSGATRASRR